ncbi:MAG: N-6 DNA methylase [Clostridium sp.]|nr:N-6 DNA methylase [Clostridium sp.]
MDLGQVFTKNNIADYMASLFTVGKEARILDPCFGGGVFLASLKKRGYRNVTGYEIDETLFSMTKTHFPDYCLYRADFLKADESVKYDGIIMNPPYVRQEKIDDLERYGITKQKLRKNALFQGLPSTANLYMYFIMKTIKLLADNGELIVIFPESWLKARSGEKFKSELQKQCRVQEEIYVSGNVFEEKALVEVLILKLKKNRQKTDKITKKLVAGENGLQELSLQETPLQGMASIELGFQTSFREIARVHRGLSTGWNSFFINPDVEDNTHKQAILSTPKAVPGYRTKDAAYDTLFVVEEDKKLSGGWLAYIEAAQKEMAEKKSPKTLYEKYSNGAAWYKLHPVDSRGILFSYFVRNDMKFIMNDTQCPARDNFYIIQPKNENDIILLFALLNNIYTYIQLELAGKKYGAGLLKLQRYDMENIRFPTLAAIADADKKKLADYAEKLMETGDRRCIADITKVLEKYAAVKAENITREYDTVKTARLGEKHGKKCD